MHCSARAGSALLQHSCCNSRLAADDDQHVQASVLVNIWLLRSVRSFELECFNIGVLSYMTLDFHVPLALSPRCKIASFPQEQCRLVLAS